MIQTTGAEYISVADAAKMLSLSRRTVERRIKDATIAVLRIGRTIRIPLSEVERLVNQDAMPKE